MALLSAVIPVPLVMLPWFLFGCGGGSRPVPLAPGGANDDGEGRRAEREEMVRTQLAARGIDDGRVLEAMRSVPRHSFVPLEERGEAYIDSPLPIGYGQTISQPYIVAFMTQELGLGGDERVLEIGTGSGYQAAVLAALVRHVYSIEIVAPLAERAAGVLAELGYDNVSVVAGDGYRGWPEMAPFDAILLTAAPDHVPTPLLEQLAVGGTLLAPIGDLAQEIVRIRRTPGGFEREELIGVRFVPMTGEAQGR